RFNSAVAPNFEVSAATAIDPNPTTIVAPRVVVDAIGIATLAHEPHTAVGVDGARVAAHVVRRAVDKAQPAASRLPAAATAADLEVGAAAAIDPDAAAIVAPGAAVVARRAAALSHELHAAARIGRAADAAAVVGRAIN